MTTHTFSKEWPERWARSLKKWEIFKEMLESKDISFLVMVRSYCGYCEEFIDETKVVACLNCNLSKKSICHLTFANNIVFWKFYVELKKVSFLNNSDLKEIIKLVDEIITAIKEDDPSKTTVSA